MDLVDRKPSEQSLCLHCIRRHDCVARQIVQSKILCCKGFEEIEEAAQAKDSTATDPQQPQADSPEGSPKPCAHRSRFIELEVCSDCGLVLSDTSPELIKRTASAC